jgi:hypothetical protein
MKKRLLDGKGAVIAHGTARRRKLPSQAMLRSTMQRLL